MFRLKGSNGRIGFVGSVKSLVTIEGRSPSEHSILSSETDKFELEDKGRPDVKSSNSWVWGWEGHILDQ